MGGPKRDKVTRTIRIDAEVDERLQVVCKRLGSTINSFLISAVGECVVKHEAQMRIEGGILDVMRESVAAMISAASDSQLQDQDLNREIAKLIEDSNTQK
jgi:ABC-type ATPase with predicted acetyltransferase domain